MKYVLYAYCACALLLRGAFGDDDDSEKVNKQYNVFVKILISYLDIKRRSVSVT
jgi:hypothetical protein